MSRTPSNLRHACAVFAASSLLLVTACGDDDTEVVLPSLSPAMPGTLVGTCAELAAKLTTLADTTITASNDIAAGTLMVAGQPVPEHCQVTGKMFQRVSSVDGNNYAIGFEMRLPLAWNGRFFYQANGGIDGSVSTAQGAVSGAPSLTNALFQGFAVISSDAGHAGSLGPFFGIDPQARLDYGYQAVGKLTPMAKSAIQTAYGKGPDRSYLGGCSNGGRHTLVAAARYADQYDGFLAGDPGFRLPLAAVANIAAVQAYATVATVGGDPGTGYTADEQKLVASAVLARCDALDGATDGLVQDVGACQAAFNLDRDVPTCSGARDGTCLSAAQKSVIAQRFAGVTDQQRRQVLFELGLRRRHRQRQHPAVELQRAPDTGFGRSRLHLAGAARGSQRLQRPGFCSQRQHRHDADEDPGHRCHLHRKLAVLHDATAPERSVDAEESWRQAHGLSRHQRPDLLQQRHHGLVPVAALGQWRQRRQFRALLPSAGHDALLRWSGHRPV